MNRLFSIILLLFALAACGNNTTPYHGGVQESKQVDATAEKILIVYGNEEFEDNLVVTRKVFDESGNLPQCSVTLQNLSNKAFVVEYQFVWMSKSGIPIMQSAAWHRLTLAPNAVKPLINVAKTPEAGTVEFTVRLPLTAMYQPQEKK